MTTIPNLNLVFQQAGNALRIMNVQQQAMGQSFLMEGQAQQSKNEERRTTVTEFEESEKLKLDSDGGGHGGGASGGSGKTSEEQTAETDTEDLPDATGRLLNTVV